jgi:propionate CoA-transferase
LIEDGDTVIISASGGGMNEATAILGALEARFLQTGHPRDLTVCHPCGLGDGKGGGTDRFAHPGLVRRVIAGHWFWSPRICHMILNDQVEAYCWPQGVISHLFRATAGGRPGVVTHVGLGTFADPRLSGGKCNARTTEELVEVITLGGHEVLFYPAFPVDVAIIRGTTADEHGNITMEREGVTMEALTAAMAAHNSGGKVLAQVQRTAASNSLDPRQVRVPGILVDAVVVDPDQRMSAFTDYNPAYAGEIRVPVAELEPLPLNVSKVVARRAALELRPGLVVNLGFGMSDGVAAIAAEEAIFDRFTLTIEQGATGGIPALGGDFGLATNPQAILDAPSQFDFYDGGGIDISFLAFAQVDARGNVNVSRFGGRLIGPGGFINASQNAKRVVFCGTFTTKGLDVDISEDGLRILREGQVSKFVEQVEEITFSGHYAYQQGQQVLYVTDRAVFRLVEDGLELVEVAPGVDLERDVLAQMAFRPQIASELRTIDPRVYRPETMGLWGE